MNGGHKPLVPLVLCLIPAGAILVSLLSARVSAVNNTGPAKKVPAAGIVTDSQNRPIVGATVYFVDTSLMDVTSAMTSAGILDGTTEGFDEPLEDIIRNPAKAKLLPHAVTNRKGKFKATGLKVASTYYAYVIPAASDTNHLPGGDLSRYSFTPNAFSKTGLHINVSWNTPPDATYIGTTACFQCHRLSQYKQHAHQLGLQVPQQLSPNQDLTRYPTWGEFLSVFTEATAYTDQGVKTLYYEDYNPANGYDKFKVYQDAPGGGVLYMKVYLWQTGGAYKVTLENQLNINDTPLTLNVILTYGGAFYRQVLLVDAPGRKGRYPFLQFQSFSDAPRSAGNDSYYDTTRHVFRDYGGGRFFSAGPDNTFGTSDDMLTLPPVTETFEGQCAGCHFTGAKVFVDPTTQEILASAVPDINGAFDPDNSGSLQEVNVGCESCHGPGSTHRANAPLPAAATKTPNPPGKLIAAYIVQPGYLAAERASMICGQCHEQVLGKSTIGVREVPLDVNEQMPRPGISRADFLANHTSRKSFALNQLWTDQIHPKIHRSQYSTWLKSQHARNVRQMAACDDCHMPHGDSPFNRFLFDDPNNADSLLCQRCHALDVTAHSLQTTGDVMLGASMRCIDCHMIRTARSGTGYFGLTISPPTGAPLDVNNVYWENDLSSHVMDVPSKLAASGVPPGTAMPVPYTRACAPCHRVSGLPFLPP